MSRAVYQRSSTQVKRQIGTKNTQRRSSDKAVGTAEEYGRQNRDQKQDRTDRRHARLEEMAPRMSEAKDNRRKDAFTVTQSNQLKRNPIKKNTTLETKAQANPRSESTHYVSIMPSRVGGNLTIQEVRKKQQDSMNLAQGCSKVDPILTSSEKYSH
ncbi:uncharacterized protein zgc:194621 [Erpetoichthys calabaricus]|uniref:uncharacterized protein zgc:194621 n=1 Tax=Erpetoichthys calabaricus TaxID=27687 RepID=UPI002234BED9|nr:uncharacterized protein zgc:194621 [Erpetoichthys calabaricus]